MFKKDGQPIALRNGMEIDGVQIVLPLAADRMAELGITEHVDQSRPDDRLYWVVDNGDGTYDATPKDLSGVVAVIWEQIKAHRDALTQSGGYSVGSNWFHSDTFSRTQQMGLVMLGQNIPQGLKWKTMGGDFVEMTPTLAQSIFAAAAASDAAIFAKAEQHHAALKNAATVEEIAAYDWRAGWPAVFEA